MRTLIFPCPAEAAAHDFFFPVIQDVEVAGQPIYTIRFERLVVQIDHVTKVTTILNKHYEKVYYFH
ncbi:hypothetical protein PDUR_25965 [Paenibacillus durus]|uniref:Uncharacterized protein n=1 Tax=Paenibacillus durus TaxID=44251 RepID=A0A089HSH3_PAEDU|nr:hypothetical protein PDUR_25965 [Paenibacillus durus]